MPLWGVELGHPGRYTRRCLGVQRDGVGTPRSALARGPPPLGELLLMEGTPDDT